MSDETVMEVFDDATTNPNAAGEEAVVDTDEKQGETSAPEDTEEGGEEAKDETAKESGEDATGEPEKPTVPRGVQKRIDEIVKQREEARADAAVLRREIEAARQAQAMAEAAKTQQPQELKPPREEDFATMLDYQEAVIEYKIEKRLLDLEQQARQATERQQQKTAQAREAAEVQAKLSALITVGQKTYADFESVAQRMPADGGPVVTDPMRNAILAVDNGPAVAYYLGKKIDESKRIADLNPVQQMIEIGRISERIANGKNKVTTQAPPPVKATGGRSTVKLDPSKMSDEEWERQRLAEKRKARK